MKISKFFVSANLAATSLALVALFSLVFKVLVLNEYQSPRSQIYDLGVIVEAILTSIVASYIFYLFVVHLKEAQDRDTLAPYIERHTLRIIESCQHQLIGVSRVSGVALDLRTITSKELEQAFSMIPPYSDAPLFLSRSNAVGNWYQFFEHHRSRTQLSISRVLSQIIYLDAKHVSLLTAIDDCSHFSSLNLLLSAHMANKNLSPHASEFFKYCEHCAELSVYMAECSRRGAF